MTSANKIGHYEIQSEVGRGGMATVFNAYDPLFERIVAVKVLPQQMTHEPEFRARFVREAKTIAALEHPAIVPVYDFGEQDDQPYLVMRYMPGGSLAIRLREGPIDVQDTAVIMARIASALDAAHQQGVIHRDLKPGNILFDQYGEAYLADFGIVRLSQSSAALTASGGVLGTPAYMSPEQVYGDKEIDGRSDIYALGVILFQMLTGHMPYDADTPAKMMMKHVMDPVPEVLAAKPDLPTECDQVIRKAMAKERVDRYPTAHDLVTDLNHATETQPSPMPAATIGVTDDATINELPGKSTPANLPQSTTTGAPEEMPAYTGMQTAVEQKKANWVWVGLVVVLLCLCAAVAISLAAVQGRRMINAEATEEAKIRAAMMATEAEQQLTSTAVAAESTTIAAESTITAGETATLQAEKTALAVEVNAAATAEAIETEAAVEATENAFPMVTLQAKDATATGIAVNAADATAMAVGTEAAGNITPLFGPSAGELTHELDDLIESTYADVNVQDFIFRAEVGNPFSFQDGRWDVGVTFRQAQSNEELRLVMRSDGVYVLNNRADGADNIVHEGDLIEHLDLTSKGSNEMVLIAQEETGYFFLNEQFIAQLDLSERMNAGDIALSTGFYIIDEQEDAATPYEYFTVWPLQTAAGPLLGEMQHIDDGLVKSANGYVDLVNFIATAVITNPYAAETNNWDYGFTFRRPELGEQFWLTVNSIEAWDLVDRRDGEDSFLVDGTLTNLNTGAGESNRITLIALDERGYFLLNDDFITPLNLSGRLTSGDVAVFTAFFENSEIEGEATTYEDFTIWALP